MPPASPPSATVPKEIKCPKCRKKVQSDFKFCPHCRAPLFCINCGYPILDRKWKACPQCGFGFK
jgi:RNA polymerase subunit RPABC4/transcription elongation factor Spt4